ncbi:acyl-CoA dehydrogenase C-terminal domain-containing protein [Mangrovitalea sediminis]|uniref:acyl-CoA dehydrogenase C-terminal domain-containing protein n=1 Tax=Mangrovitalea sediminis TaxID=1982043 RepID=UPI000BE57EF7|nr:acyl-CoA dehydrogenase C-terminal domain-containing protein [Mangrovitalea sediminis]
MSGYRHPLNDTLFVLDALVGFDRLAADLGLDGVNLELAEAILTEAGKLGSEVLAPLNPVGDRQGATLTAEGVQETPGFAEAYRQYAENGWPALVAAEELGGQGLPAVLGTAVNEIWHSANMAFALCPMLCQGAVEALTVHGSESLKEQYLPKLVSGEWTGTMNLTEPNAGSDLAAVSARAVPHEDHYRITGQKIFITWGDHQMTSNIIHLVLARLPDAPKGVKGISLFIVPKYRLDANGEPGELNDVCCVSLEHKLGIHGSPTCVLSFGDNGGATGYLVGEPHKGLMYMFTMMNNARQAVGLQGLSIAERAYQQARQYARERLQGTRADGTRIPIIEHPDVRRMLMIMKAGTEAMRALALVAMAEDDRTKVPDGQESAHHGRLELFTPIVKGWMTEMAQELTSLNVQVHGGMGFIEETGAAQHFRDARILPIYEGTSGIQALDLIGRKTLSNGGAHLGALFEEMAETLAEFDGQEDADLVAIAEGLGEALAQAKSAADEVLASAVDPALAGSVSFNFMMLMGYLCGGWLMAKSALCADRQRRSGEGDAAYLQSKCVTARFYAEHLLPRVVAHRRTMQAGSGSVMALSVEQF